MRLRLLVLCFCAHTLLGSVHATEIVVTAGPAMSFSLPDVQISAGDSIRFENAGGFHNVREVDSASSTTPVPSGFCAPMPDCAASSAAWSSAVSFPTPGIYHYVCQVHSGMIRGKVTVSTTASVPVADPQALTVVEDHEIEITLTGSAPANGAMTIEAIPGSGPAHGDLIFDHWPAVYLYRPAQDYVGPDTFDFSVIDQATNASATATVSITVVADPLVNDAPTATTRMHTTTQGVALDLTLSGLDPDGEPLDYALSHATMPSHGRLSGQPPNLTTFPILPSSATTVSSSRSVTERLHRMPGVSRCT